MIHRGGWKFRNPLLVSLLVLPAVALFAEGTSVKVGSNATLSLPAGWNIVESSQDAAPERVTSSTDLKATTLLLAARPIDPARRVGISLFRANFHSMGPPPLMAGEMGAQAETEKLLFMVLGLGFTPTAVQTSRSNSSQNTPLLTIEVTAKNVAGEERVFTDTAAGNGSPIFRLFSSRQAADQTAAQEITSIIRSFGLGDQPMGNPAGASPSRNSFEASRSPVENTAPSATPVAPTSAATAQTVSDHPDALLMVAGQKGVGSGFLCTMGGKTVAITNAHVLSGNPGFKLTNLKSTALNVAGGAISVDHDIVKLEVGDVGKGFDLIENLDTNVKIGDSVMVLGNAQGAMVVKPVEGHVVGIGPNLVEVDAPFVPGNSGSPIIHTPTGKVIGVATYYTERKVSKNGSEVEIRRFGYRLDSVKVWEPVDWQRFYAQAAQVAKIDSLSDDFIQLSKDCSNGGHLDSARYNNLLIQRAVQSFMSHFEQRRGKKIGAGDRQMILVQFFNDLRTASRSDINGFDLRTSYDYFRREVQDQIKFREAIYEDLSHSIENRSF